MQLKDLSKQITAHLNEGQHRLAHTIRQLVYTASPEWFERMDFLDDRLFLEPTLFAWFTSQPRPLPLKQILLGLIESKQRPTRTPIYSDHKGYAYIPRLGHVNVGSASTPASLLRLRDAWYVKTQDKPVLAAMEAAQSLPEHDLFVDHRMNPLLLRFFEVDQYPLLEPVPNLFRQIQTLRQALDLMAALDPELHGWITQATQTIQLYCAEQPNSFATLSAHGVAFLNVRADSDLVFYVDDLSHQCGHIIFNAVTLDKQAFLSCDPYLPLKEITDQEDETRNLYSAFHGLFTYSLILRSMDHLLRSGRLGPEQEHHTLGRIAFYLGKFATDLANLNDRALFTDQGLEFYYLFLQAYEYTYETYFRRVWHFDLGNQPYVFSRERFLKANPIQVEGTGRTQETEGAGLYMAARG